MEPKQTKTDLHYYPQSNLNKLTGLQLMQTENY